MSSPAPGERRWDWLLAAIAALAFWLGQPRSAATGGFALVPPAADVVRVVTWNVGRAKERDGAPLARELEQHVADTLRAIDADVVLLQELADGAQVMRLSRLLGIEREQRTFGPFSSRSLAIFALRGRVTNSGASDAGLIGDWQDDTGRFLRIACVHAHAWSARERNRALGATVDLLLQLAGPHLLGGDLNIDLDLDKRRDLFSDDTHRDVETYNYLATRLADLTNGTGATAEPDRRLDYIFVTRGIEHRQAGPLRDHRSGAMDHDPLIADLSLPAR